MHVPCERMIYESAISIAFTLTIHLLYYLVLVDKIIL